MSFLALLRVVALLLAFMTSAVATHLLAATIDRVPLEPTGQGIYFLSSGAVELNGKAVRYDKPTNSLADWLSKQDRANWKINTTQMGNYDVAVTWNVAEEDAPQGYNIEINHRPTIRAYTVSTGGKFKREVVGRIMLPAGVNEVRFFATRDNSRGGLCKLRQIDLIPVDASAADGPSGPLEFHLPPGFEIEQIAGRPLLSHPMLATFDDRGRLYVCESTGVNADAAVLEQCAPHEIRMLEDIDGDGKFDKSTLFADKLTFPQGIVWHDGSIYVSSPPNFWRLADIDGDGAADKREVLATGFPFTGMSDDMHGGTLGRDGRLYFAAGRMHKEIRRPNGPIIHEGDDPLIVRCRPDGSELEVFCGAMGNAVGVDFSDTGDCFASGTFGVNASGKRDVLNHCVEGGAYPVLGRILSEHKLTGGEMPNLAQFGVTASSDLMMYRDDVFGSEYRGNLFSAMFNMHKIARHILEPDGATCRCHTEDFLTSPNADFHPTDVFEDADGSLIVVDTGAWFLIGCPTSVIAKPQIGGGIYRVRRSGSKPMADPRGLSIAWNRLKLESLVTLLGDQRFAVRDRAISELAAKGELAVSVLRLALSASRSSCIRLNAVWALSRIDSPEATAAARLALSDTNHAVRQAAATTAGLFRDHESVALLSQMVCHDESPNVRREAATALGRIGKQDAVPNLLAALTEITDRFLEHAIIFALIRLDDRDQTAAGLASLNPNICRGALIALDQMDHGELSKAEVTKVLASDNARLQQASLEIISRHPDWAGEITTYLSERLVEKKLPEDGQSALRGLLLSFAKERDVQKVVAQSLACETTPRWSKLLLLDVMDHSGLRSLPHIWHAPLVAALDSPDVEIARAAIATVTTANQSQGKTDALGRTELLELVRNNKLPTDLRVAAASAIRTGVPMPDDIFQLLCEQCSAQTEPVTRLAAANAIGSAKLDETQQAYILEMIATAGPLEISALIRPFEDADLVALGGKLLTSLAKSPGISALPGDRLVKLISRLPATAQPEADRLLQQSHLGLQGQRQRLDELKGALTGGDASRGRSLFFGNKAACSACHRIGDEGGNIGPNLTGIGEIRSRKDLLEAVAFPSASFARNFEPYTVLTTKGIPYSGIITRANNDAIFLTTTERTTIRVLRSDIEEGGIIPAKVSIMPQGLDRLLQPDELRDLLAFLSAK